jgi:hypothetical protein
MQDPFDTAPIGDCPAPCLRAGIRLLTDQELAKAMLETGTRILRAHGAVERIPSILVTVWDALDAELEQRQADVAELKRLL